MNPRLYRAAYKFLKLRATIGGMKPFTATEHLNQEEQNTVYKFLSYQHQVKLI